MNFKVIMTLLILTTLTLFSKTGYASWYGAKFQGKPTASGEPFDMYAYTAAHRNLPFGTILTVTNLSNHKSVNVRVNDRGPFVNNRMIDLSYQAARKIGLLQSGVSKVSIQIHTNNPYLTDKQEANLKEYGRPKVDKQKKFNVYLPSNVKRRVYYKKVQIAAFRSKRNALRLLKREQRRGHKMKLLSKYIPSKRRLFYKVVILCRSTGSARDIINSRRYKGAYLLR